MRQRDYNKLKTGNRDMYNAEGYAYDRKDKGVEINAAVKMSVLQAL